MIPAASERINRGLNSSVSSAVVAIVVSYNSALELAPCLASLQSQRGVGPDIRVVDNASSDGSAERVRSEFPGVRLETNAQNAGFARANNQVVERDEAELYPIVTSKAILAP